MSKAADRAAQLKARMTQETAQHTSIAPVPDDRAARAHFVGASVLDQLTNGRTVQAVLVQAIAPEAHEELRQPRLLPLPEALRPDGDWDASQQPLIDELLALGRSLQARQIQPIVIYPGTSPAYPAARYLIAVGHRRWTAAMLVGMATIDAVLIDPPSPEDLVDIQYTENEDRADFSDMERAWALARMKQVLHDAPWDVVEQRFRLSEGRRKQLMRLMAFPPAQQHLVARLRASETQLRPLHAALREGALTSEQTDRILQQLVTKASPPAPHLDTEGVPETLPPPIDRRTVTQLLSRVQRTTRPSPPTPRPKWLDPLTTSLTQTRKGLQRLPDRAQELDQAMASELRTELEQLLATLTHAMDALPHQDSE